MHSSFLHLDAREHSYSLATGLRCTRMHAHRSTRACQQCPSRITCTPPGPCSSTTSHCTILLLVRVAGKFKICMDPASSEFFRKGKYDLKFKSNEGKGSPPEEHITPQQLTDVCVVSPFPFRCLVVLVPFCSCLLVSAHRRPQDLAHVRTLGRFIEPTCLVSRHFGEGDPVKSIYRLRTRLPTS